MRIVADRIAVGSGPTAELPPLSLEFSTEQPTAVAVGAGQRPTVLSLVLTGRMRPTAGRVLLDDREDPAALRRSLALVDTPTVAEPHEDLALATVIREELALAHQRAGSGVVRGVLRDLGASEWAEAPVRLVPGAVRLRLLAELASRRAGVRGLVLTSPERHGVTPAELATITAELRDRSLAVLTITTAATQAALVEGTQS